MTFLFRVLLDASVRISLVAIAVCGIIYLFRIQSSSLRHKAWLGVLFAMLSMPVLPRIVPAPRSSRGCARAIDGTVRSAAPANC